MDPLAMIAFPGPGILILLLAAVSVLSTSLVTSYFGTTTKEFLQPKAQIAFVGSVQLGVLFFAACRLDSATADFWLILSLVIWAVCLGQLAVPRRSNGR